MNKDQPHIDWLFPPSHGRERGIDPLIDDTFGDYSFVREIIQNSLDAVSSHNQPVRVKFELLDWQLEDIPGHASLKEAFEALIHRSADQATATPKLKPFIDRLQKRLQSGRLPVLKISDYQTTGLSGADHAPGAVHSLLYSEGVTHGDQGRGGSFGFGKKAPFISSDLRTCFYLSHNQQDETILAGQTHLPSFRLSDPDGLKDGVGYWGQQLTSDDSRFPLSYSLRRQQDLNHLEPHQVWQKQWRQREHRPGLDIYLIGYSHAGSRWELPILDQVIKNFWGSIHFQKLVVTIKSQPVNQPSLEINLNHQNLREQIERRQENKDLQATSHFYSAVADNPSRQQSDTISYYGYQKQSLDHLGEVELYLKNLSHEPEPKIKVNKIACMRQPRMLVEEKAMLSPISYAGVFVCDNEQGNQILRDLEPATHNQWRTRQGVQSDTKTQDRLVIRELNRFIRECLGRLESPHRPQRSIPILSDICYIIQDKPDTKKGPEPLISLRSLPADNDHSLHLLVRTLDGNRLVSQDLCLEAKNDNQKYQQVWVNKIVDLDSGQELYQRSPETKKVILSQFKIKKGDCRRLYIEFDRPPEYQLRLRPLGASSDDEGETDETL